ncbi:MAG: hypothetical protein VX294_04770 [Candidatus Latescibacterota bacterium]|nr:hypothetical protein [Candidatus Latescibacterota bacterium]
MSRTSILLVFLMFHAAIPQQYSLNFSSSSTRTQWRHRLPSWQYRVPVRLSSVADSTSELSVSSSASLGFTLDNRNGKKTWQDNASIGSTINYPILGPKATIGIGANMSLRSATLQKQKLRNQTFNFRFMYKPIDDGRFDNLTINVTPGLITKTRDSRANLDSTITEKGIQYNASLRVSPDLKVGGKKLGNSLSFTKRDNTLKNNKDRSEGFSSSGNYTFPGKVRVSTNFSESRSELGVTRSVISDFKDDVDGVAQRDTSVSAEISESRSTNFSTSIDFDIRRFKIKNNVSMSSSTRTNSASAQQDVGNRYFGTDRESNRWNWQSELSGKLIQSIVVSSKIRMENSDQRNLGVRVLDIGRCANHFVTSSGNICRDPSSDLSNSRMFLNTSLTWTIDERNSIRMTSWADLKQSQNPGASDQNRDTFSNSFSLRYDGTLAQESRFNVEVRTSFLHRVNLAASRSASNSRNRDIVLDAGTNYERLGVSFSHSFSISAKRTIFDFDRQINRRNSSRESNIRRGWSMNHTVNRKLMSYLRLNGRYTYSADDFGTLIVEHGSQIVEEDNNRHSIGLGLSYSPTVAFSMSTNYSYLLDRRWDHEYLNAQELRIQDIARRNNNRSLSMNINYNPKDSPNKLTLRGSRSRQRSGTFNSFNATYSRAL